MQPRVLVFEDDPEIRRLLAELLGECGMDAVTSDHRELPDVAMLSLVVTDLLPNGGRYSGDLATAWVRELKRRYGVPVLVVTGHSDAWADADLKHDAEVIVKPVDLTDLERRVQRVLGRS